MEIKELRIGNYVHNNVESFRLEAKDLMFLMSFDNIHYAEPIPLTEEWLVKFGFEKDSSNCTEDHPWPDYVKDDIVISLPYFEFSYGNSSVELNYVHKLQNLFSLLNNGNDLEVIS